MKRLGLARSPEDALSRAVHHAGWEPIRWEVTELSPVETPMPVATPLAAVVLSPAGARLAKLPAGLPCLVTGEATGRALGDREILVSAEPRAEGLWDLLRQRFPEGGDFLLIRGERSRGFLEEAAAETAWRLHPWITHCEAPLDPPPARPDLDAVLALSPLQAEVLARLCPDLPRFAWGTRAGAAFDAGGAPATAVCESKSDALERMLRSYL